MCYELIITIDELIAFNYEYIAHESFNDQIAVADGLNKVNQRGGCNRFIYLIITERRLFSRSLPLYLHMLTQFSNISKAYNCARELSWVCKLQRFQNYYRKLPLHNLILLLFKLGENIGIKYNHI